MKGSDELVPDAPVRAVAPIDVPGAQLGRVGERPGLFRYIAELWSYRSFVFYNARSRLQSQNTSHFLGNLWLVLTPVLNGLTYFLIFGILLQTSRGVQNFLGFLIIGVFMFQFTSRSVSGGARSLQQNRNVVRAFQFPRATLPLAENLRELMGFMPGFAAMFALILLLPPSEPVSWKWLLVIPVLALQFLLNLGLSLFIARLVSTVSDFAQLIPFALRLWMYGSGVFYSFERFVSHPTALAILEFNPMHQVLDITRNAILYDSVSSPQSWLILACWSIGTLAVGLVFFWASEEKYGAE